MAAAETSGATRKPFPALQNMITPETERAVEAGLGYLRERQDGDGSWGGRFRSASTAAAVMAFMVTGELPADGEDARRLDAALAWLIARSEANGGYMGTSDKGMYEHALATLAMAEAVGESPRPRIMATLESAVGVIVGAQNQQGGWRYTPDNDQADLSVTAMQVVALVAASEAGVTVPAAATKRAREYIESCFNVEEGGFMYRPNSGGAGFARTAAGAAALMFLADAKVEPITASVDYLARNREAGLTGNHTYYGLYYAAQCMYRAGEDRHQRWYPFVRDALIERQRPDGSWRGSPGGEAFSTAMAIIVLGAEYRYLPIYQR